MSLSCKRSGPVCVVVFEVPYLDASNARELGIDLATAVGEATGVVLDLTRVAMIDSTGLGLLLTTERSARTRGGRVVLAGVGARVRQLLHLVKLETVLTSCATPDDAIALLVKPS